MQPIILTSEQLATVAHLSTREAAKTLGVGKSTISKYRNMIEAASVSQDSSFSKDADGTITLSLASGSPVTLEDALSGLESQKVDISAHNVSYSLNKRELANGEIRYTYSVRAVPKKPESVDAVQSLDASELVAAIENFSFTPLIKVEHEETFVICPSDMQIGKTSFNGGTTETIERVLESFGKAVEFVKEFKPSEIVIAELGDPLENFYSTSSQRETNDLDLTGQLRVARRLLLQGVKELAPYTKKLTYAAVPSNHGSVRIGFKAPAGDNHNDFGLEIQSAVEDAVRENVNLNHVIFVRPDKFYESLSLTTNGTRLGMVHGHQAGKAEGLNKWWTGQTHGGQPTAAADILLAGHFHSFRVQHSGGAKWIMVSPSSDNGSDWWTNITGEYSKSGMLSFTCKDGTWENLRIL